VGVDVPPGARKGGFGLGDKLTTPLSVKLADHVESIKLTTNWGKEMIWGQVLKYFQDTTSICHVNFRLTRLPFR